jgi:hypothetical protein
VSTTPKLHVQGDAAARKAQPIARGCLDYFPDALLAVAELSRIGNEQHNPGQPLHWAKEKSTDEADALLRHLIDRGAIDTDGVRHSTKVAWRALALLQREIDAERDHIANLEHGRIEGVRHITTNHPIPVIPRYPGQLDEPANCSICGRPECGSVEPACVGNVWPAS